MGKKGGELDIDFVISAGDNFYDNGLTGVDDEAFEQSFTSVYTAKSLQKKWYSGESLSYFASVVKEMRSVWLLDLLLSHN